jgi:cell division protein FtsQ
VARVPEGEPLARIDLDTIKARVQALAVVKSADVTRQWPDEVLIEVEERVAIAVVDIGGQARGMDADGVVFAEYRRAPAGLPHVQTSSDTRNDALREAAAVISALPEDLSARVDHVAVETIDRISLVMRDGRIVMWGSADESETKAAVLVELLGQKARTYDVSVPGRPTTSD